MRLSAIALKNLKKNFSFYSLYLFSVSFVLMIYFCFTSFSMNQVIMDKISSDGRVETMCRTVGVFIMAFVVFYMFYSNNFFMRRRMKELGIYSLLGYSKFSMLELLTFENILICFGGMVLGILAGGVLHKIVIAGIVALLGLSVDQSVIPLIYPKAVTSIVAFVVVILVTLTLSNARLLHKSTLLDLVRLERKIEKPIRIRFLSAFIGISCIMGGYGLALDMVIRGVKSVWHTIGFSPIAMLTMLLVVAGTIFFIYSFLPYVCQKIRGRKRTLYRENTIIVVPKFMHRIRTNAKSLILLILLSAGTQAILGATTLSVWYPIAALERIIPSAIEYRVTDDEEKERSLDALDRAIGSDAYESCETVLLKVTAISDRLPSEYSISSDKGRDPGFECISQSAYSALMALQGKQDDCDALQEDECILIKYRPDEEKADVGAEYTLTVQDNPFAAVKVRETSLQNPIGFGNSVGTLVVSDSLYGLLCQMGLEEIHVVSIGGKELRSSQQAYTALHDAMPENIYLASAWQRQDELIQASSSTFLLICFATIIFLIATGSILYFQNISSVSYDKPDYKIMHRMGYDRSMIKRCVRRQIQIYYVIPYVMGMLHSIFAIACYKSALMDDVLGKGSTVIVPVALAVVIFTLIYIIYYQVTKRSCYKIALQ